jgi:hypothetical protein
MTMPITKVVWQKMTLRIPGDAKNNAAYRHGSVAADNAANRRGGAVDNDTG